MLKPIFIVIFAASLALAGCEDSTGDGDAEAPAAPDGAIFQTMPAG